MKKYTLILFILLFLFPQIRGQLKTYLVSEAGPAWDLIPVSGGGTMVSPAKLPGHIGGVAAWQEIIPNLSIGTGIYVHDYLTGLNVNDMRPNQPVLQSHRAVLIPARISYRFHPEGFPLGLTARLGYELGLIPGDRLIHQASSLISNGDGEPMTYLYSETFAQNGALHMVEAGVSADYRFTNNWQVSLNFSHFSGLSEIRYATVDYTLADGNSYEANYSHSGSRMQTTFSLGIPVSNVWENRDLRLRRKIENSLGRGGSLRRSDFIYFGGDLGALWRSFATSNPAIGARPIDDPGVLRYSNLHAGIFGGYMFNVRTGIDLGIYYQGSSLYYSIMYDHETDFTEINRAPMFLEVPLMFRYFIDLYDMELFLVPAIGGSVLTHFSGQNYAAGSAAFNYQTLSGAVDGTANYTVGRPVRLGYGVKAALGIEYDIPTPFPMLVTLNFSYTQGLRDIEVIEVTTSVNEVPDVSTITYNGTGWGASLGVRVPISLDKDSRKCGALPRMR